MTANAAFIAKHEIIAKVFDKANIGRLVDELRQADVYKISSFEWKSDEVELPANLGKERVGHRY